MLLTAPILKNPGKPPIENPAIWIQKNTVRFVGPRPDLPKDALKDPETRELKNHLLLPGLVNAHSHLELTALADLPYPGDFVSWIRKILEKKNGMAQEEQKHSVKKGIVLSLLGGTCTVGDHISFNGEIEDLLDSPLRGKTFIEVLGVAEQVAEELFQRAQELSEIFSNRNGLFEIIPTPHAVHSLVPEILEAILKQDRNLFSLHLAESEVEREYFESSSGPLQELIAERGSRLNRKSRSSVFELERLNLLNDRIMAIHGNYLTEKELNLLSKNKISIVHCPLSHQYFGHRPFPLRKVRSAEINVALGTDSLASASSLSMFEVVRQTQRNFPDLSKEEILKMATIGGAIALKMGDQIGEVIPGKKADIIGIPFKDKTDPLEALFEAEEVTFSMIDGAICLDTFNGS